MSGIGSYDFIYVRTTDGKNRIYFSCYAFYSVVHKKMKPSPKYSHRLRSTYELTQSDQSGALIAGDEL